MVAIMANSAMIHALIERLEMQTVYLDRCEYDKERKVLKLGSEVIGMPREFMVRSHITGKEVRFVAIGPEDVLFDQDGWDGEQCIYRPTSIETIDTVNYMVIYNH